MAPKRNKPQPPHQVVCACGCETPFLVPHPRWKANKTGMFFFKQTHFSLGADKHWNWRGGPAFYGLEWPRIAKEIRERDGVCGDCGKAPEENGRALDVHHIVPVRVAGDNSPENLIALCKSCHHKRGMADEVTYPRPPLPLVRVCLHCGNEFEPRRADRQLCSTKCQEDRRKALIASYPRLDRRPGGKDYEANKVRKKRWQKENAARVNAYHREKRAEAPEKHRAYGRNYYAKHKTEKSEAGHAYYIRNREKLLAGGRAHYAANKDEILARQRARRTTDRKSGQLKLI